MNRRPARPYDRALHWRAFVEELSLNVRAAPWVWPIAVLVTALCTWGGVKLGGPGLTIAIAPWAVYPILLGAIAFVAYEKSHRDPVDEDEVPGGS